MMVSEKQWLHMCILYVIVIDVVLPVIFAKKMEEEEYMNENLISIILEASTIFEAYYNLLFDPCERRFITRKRRCVSDICF